MDFPHLEVTISRHQYDRYKNILKRKFVFNEEKMIIIRFWGQNHSSYDKDHVSFSLNKVISLTHNLTQK